MNYTLENRLGTLVIMNLSKNVKAELIFLDQRNHLLDSQDELLATVVEYLTECADDDSIAACTIMINAKNYLITDVDTFLSEIEQDTGVGIWLHDGTYYSKLALNIDTVFIPN